MSGGVYGDPTPEMVNAVHTIGEATNDIIESLIGTLERYLFLLN